MKAVGVKVLKAKLSEYLRLVKTGVTVLVTERDEVIAEIHPARRQRIGELSLHDKLVAMAERGEATKLVVYWLAYKRQKGASQ